MNFIKKYYLIIIVVALGFALRAWGLCYGLPFPLHQDEPIVVNHAIAYGTGDLNPHFFIIPPLCSYLLFAAYGVYFLTGQLSGIFAGVEDFALSFFTDPSGFYLIARIVLALIPGTLGIWLTYLLYKGLFYKGPFREQGATYAASIVAVSFLCVVNAHYAYVDNMMVLLVLAMYLSCVRIIRKPSIGGYVLTGVLIGLATSAKYNAALVLFTFYCAHVAMVLLNGRDIRELIFNRSLLFALLAAAVTFIVTNPFSVLDWRFFLISVPGRIRGQPMGWGHHITYSLYEGVGPWIPLAAAAGIAAVIVKMKKPRAVFFLSFPALFYLHLVFRSQRFSRYVLPLVPFLGIAASFLVFGVIMPRARNWKQAGLVIALALSILAPSLVKTVKADLLFNGKDTRAVSAEWIKANIPQGAGIAVDHTSFRPAISQTREQLRRKFVISGSEQGLKAAKDKKLEYMLKAAEEKKTYNVYFLGHKDMDEVQFMSEAPVIEYDVEKMRDSGIDYVVINHNTSSGSKGKFIEELEKHTEVARFSPYYNEEIRPPYDRNDHTYMSIGSAELYSRRAAGPCLVIYKIESDTQVK